MSSLFAPDKELADKNIPLISATLGMSKLSGWSNAVAFWNMALMLVTRAVSKLSGWLKLAAPCAKPNGKGTYTRGASQD